MIRLKLAMALMSPRMFLLLNAGCFLFLLLTVLSFTLSLLPFLLALAIMIINLYHTLQAYFAPSPTRSFQRNEGRKGELELFQQRVREAYDHSMRKTDARGGDEYFWSKSQLRQAEGIEELRRVSLAEQQKGSFPHRDVLLYRDDASSAKKVRAFFQLREEVPDERMKAAVAQGVVRAGKLVREEEVRRKAEEVRPRVSGCLRIINQFIKRVLQEEMERVIEDFQTANKFLSRCFSLSLTLTRPSPQAITPTELQQLVTIIDQKQMVPSQFTCNISFVELANQLSEVREQLARLPNFRLGAGVLRMVMALKHFRKEFPNDSIVLADFCKEEQKGELHVLRVQDNGRFYYNREPSLKSEQPAAVLLLVVAAIMKKYPRNPLARSIHAEIEGRYY